MSSILVTGGAGFVGSHLVEALLARGHSVRVFDNLSTQAHGAEPPASLAEAEFISGDMRDPGTLHRALEGIEIIFHLAAVVGVEQSTYEIAHYVSANTHGTAVLLQELVHRGNRVHKLVLASSMTIYGEGRYVCASCGDASGYRRPRALKQKLWDPVCPQCGEPLTPMPTDESKPPDCNSIYALTKKYQEEMCFLFGRTYGLPVVALRYSNIYGPRQGPSHRYTGVAGIFASRLRNGNAPLIFEDGKQTRDFLNVRDAVQAALLAAELDRADGLAINVGSGQRTSISELAGALVQAFDGGGDITPVFTGKSRPGDIRHCFADIARARMLLGYTPGISLAAGLHELIHQPGTVAEPAKDPSGFGMTLSTN